MSEPGGLFTGVLARGAARTAVSDAAWLAAILETEVALAEAEAEAGLVAPESAEAIRRAASPDAFDSAALGRAAVASGNPVIPVVEALRAAVGEPAASAVHLGATSQDILDTAAMLVAGRAIDALSADLDGAARAAARLADEHRHSLMAARTLMRQAVPTTFGLKAAGWLAGLDAAAIGLARQRHERLAVQLGGAGGTLAALGETGPRVTAGLARILGLGEPAMPWHAERSRIADLAGALGTAGASASKPALDIVLLGQTEVGEVADDRSGTGGSSAMPHKQNQVAAIMARAAALQVPGLVATLLAAAGGGEHERAAGAWQAEWAALSALLQTVGSALAWLRDALEHLQVDAGRMRQTVRIANGLLLSERIAAALAPSLGRAGAERAFREAAAAARTSGRPLTEVLAGRPAVRERLASEEIARLVDPATSLGAVDLFIDRALAAHAARRDHSRRASR